MFRSFIICFLLLLQVCGVAQSKVLQSLSFESTLLSTDVKYSVYLPGGYDSSNTSYPVIYLLNGFTGDENDWIRVGLLKDIADELQSGNKIIPMVIIMPDGDDRLYMNKDDGTYPYEDMFIKELLPFMEKTYRINTTQTAISGLSMGGSGSLRLAFKYPELFNVCAAYSAGISTDEEIMNEAQQSFDDYFGRISPSVIGKKGKDRLNATLMDYDVLRLVEKSDPELLKQVQIYFDCGDDDFLTVGNTELHIMLTKKGVPHEFRMRDGGHTWNYWRNSLPVGLEFISNMFRK